MASNEKIYNENNNLISDLNIKYDKNKVLNYSFEKSIADNFQPQLIKFNPDWFSEKPNESSSSKKEREPDVVIKDSNMQDKRIPVYMNYENSYTEIIPNIIKVESCNNEFIKNQQELIKGIQTIELPEVQGACSPVCFKILNDYKYGINVISAADKTKVKIKFLIEKKDYCTIATEMNVPCNTIYRILKDLASRKLDCCYIPKHKKRRLSSSSSHAKINDFNLTQTTLYNPCTCGSDGSCDENCPCFLSKNFCEIFCGCSIECLIRFSGCRCQGKCNTNKCPCFSILRECQVGLCFCKSDNVEGGTCTNMKIYNNIPKKLIVKDSKIAGLGAFAGEPIAKGDFIIEYSGELITEEEAERRGKIYDINRVSYLFTLSSDYVIDAMYMGNESRFINHSKNPNCYARIKSVYGDKRIGFYAMRNIEVDEELLFNYNYSEDKMNIYFKK